MIQSMCNRRGIALGSVLLLVAAFTVIALAVASAVTFSLQVSSRLENQQIALEMADAALQQTLAELIYNPDYGGQKERLELSGVTGMDASARGLVTFDPQEGQPFCTNNRSGDRPLG
jgi:type II secretory pathway component PulK